MHHRDPHDDPPRRGDRVPSKPVATLGQIHTAADYFNGVAFAPAEPHWVGFFDWSMIRSSTTSETSRLGRNARRTLLR